MSNLPTAATSLMVRRPEVWVWGVAGAAWVVMLGMHPGGGASADHLAAHQHQGGGSMAASNPDLAVVLLLWVLMVVAMMTPTVAPALHVVAHRSLRRRQLRAMLLFLIGYVAVWILAGSLVTVAVAAVSPDEASLRRVTVAALLLAAVYEVTGWKRRALGRCQILPSLPLRGVRADRACAQAGWRNGKFCLASCWALMLTLAVDRHSSLALSVMVTTVVWGERLLTSRRRRVPRAALLLAAAALLLSIAIAASSLEAG